MHLPRPASRQRPGVVWLLFAVSCVAFAGAPRAESVEEGLSLPEALSLALRDGYGARIARLEAGQAQDQFLEQRGGYLPHVWVTSGAGFSSRRGEKLVALDQNFRVREYGIAALASDEGWLNVFVEQLVFDVRKWKMIEHDKIAAEAAQLSERADHEQVALDVTTRFSEIARLQRQADLAQREVDEARWLDEQAAKLLDAGRALASERELVALHLAEAEIEAQSRAAEAREARIGLWSAISGGEDAGVPLRVRPDSLPEPTLGMSPEALEAAVAEAPAARVLELRRRMEEAKVGAASARRLPTLGFRAGYSHYGADRYDLFPDEYRVGIDLRVPIFDGFEARSAISGAQKGVEIARLRYQSLLESKRNRVRELIRKLESSSDRLALARRRATTSDELQRLTDLKLQSERASVDEALSARERSIQDAREAIDTFFTRFEVWTALQHELGLLSTAVLGNAVATP